MPYSLSYLEKASGYAGSAGQSFGNNVAGAGPGAGMASYKCDGWNWTGGPSTNPLGGSYEGTQQFTMDVSFNQGAKAPQIKRTGPVIVFNDEAGNNGGGYSARVVSQNVAAEATGSTMTIEVTPPVTPTTGASISAAAPWYVNYPAPSTPPQGAGTQPVRFAAALSNGAGSSQVVTVGFSFSYAPDNGPFNPLLTQSYSGIPFTTRSETLSDYEYEWHSNATYSALFTTASSFVIDSDPLYSVSYWLRYRRIGASSWTNAGESRWEDQRFA